MFTKIFLPGRSTRRSVRSSTIVFQWWQWLLQRNVTQTACSTYPSTNHPYDSVPLPLLRLGRRFIYMESLDTRTGRDRSLGDGLYLLDPSGALPVKRYAQTTNEPHGETSPEALLPHTSSPPFVPSALTLNFPESSELACGVFSSSAAGSFSNYFYV